MFTGEGTSRRVPRGEARRRVSAVLALEGTRCHVSLALLDNPRIVWFGLRNDIESNCNYSFSLFPLILNK